MDNERRPAPHEERVTYTLRRAQPADLDTVAQLLDRYRVFYGRPSDLPAARHFVEQRLGARDSEIILAATPDGRGLGFTQLYPTFSTVRLQRVWILNDLFVEPDARRGGVAGALMQAAVAFAKKDGAAGLQLETARDNAPAKKLYESLGWTEESSFDTYTFWF